MDFLDTIFERANHHGKKGHRDNYYPHEHHENHNDDNCSRTDHHSHGRAHHNENYPRYDQHSYHKENHYSFETIRPIIAKVLKNKPLLIGLAVGSVFFLLLTAVLCVMHLPFFVQAFDSINKHGLKGIVDTILPIVDRLWRGQE